MLFYSIGQVLIRTFLNNRNRKNESFLDNRGAIPCILCKMRGKAYYEPDNSFVVGKCLAVSVGIS